MDAAMKQEGDALAKELIREYWDIFINATGTTWNFYLQSLRYDPADRWATREQWLDAAKQAIDRKTSVLAGLEIMLAEGHTEYLDLAHEVVAYWRDKLHEHDAYYYYDILKYFPPDDAMRRKYLSFENEYLLSEDNYARTALVSIEDEAVCKQLAKEITHAFTASPLDEQQAECALRFEMRELGRLCQKYLAPEVVKQAKKFCMEFLLKDMEVAPYFRSIPFDYTKPEKRITWIVDDIAVLAWRIGWLDILEDLRNEQWYWDRIYVNSDCDNVNLLVWSRFARNAQLQAQALTVMRKKGYDRMDGAIAWMRMTHVRWPPQ